MGDIFRQRGDMNQVRWWAVALVLCGFTTIGAAQREICVGSIGGGDAVTWNIQQPLLKAIDDEAQALGVKITTRLLTNNNEKAAKGEMQALKCDYGLITSVSREWPQPKGQSGISGGGGGGGGGKDDNPHPPSIAHFEFTLVDKNAKRMDRFKTQIEMQIRYTAKDVEPDLKEIIQQVANWTLDGTTGSK
jgi:hypothetical protein